MLLLLHLLSEDEELVCCPTRAMAVVRWWHPDRTEAPPAHQNDEWVPLHLGTRSERLRGIKMTSDSIQDWIESLIKRHATTDFLIWRV